MPKKKSNAPLHVAFCLDMSGSMSSIHASVVEGFNDYVQQLKTDEGEIFLSLTVFDTVFEEWFKEVPINDFPTNALNNYIPRGGTALYDAVANTIANVSKTVPSGDNVLIVVMTDGQENRSVEYRGETGRRNLQTLVQKYEKKGWVFTYLGANVDAQLEATSMGFAPGNAVYYSASPGSTRSAMSNLGAVTKGMSSGVLRGADTNTLYASSGLTTDVRDEQDAGLSTYTV